MERESRVNLSVVVGIILVLGALTWFGLNQFFPHQEQLEQVTAPVVAPPVTQQPYPVVVVPPVTPRISVKISPSMPKALAQKPLVERPTSLPRQDEPSVFVPANPPSSRAKLLLVVVKSTCRMQIWREGSFIGEIAVTIGKEDPENSTPPGRYRIGGGIIRNPVWHVPARIQREEGLPAQISAGDKNPLGKVWIPVFWKGDWSVEDPGWNEDALGMHGTNEPDKIGGPWGHGCIRMKNENVQYLAQLIGEVGIANAELIVMSYDYEE